MIAAYPGPAGGEEYAFAIDRARARRLLVVPALLDEGNKLRRLTIEVMRRLDAAAIDAFLADLPGCNESMAPLEAQTLDDWRRAMETAAAHFGATEVLAIRGGALVAPALPGRAYAPVKGASLLGGLLRARTIASKEAGVAETRDGLLAEARERGIELAGYRLGAAMVRGLEGAEPPAALAPIAPADVGGAGLWLRAEPDFDPRQADALAAIVAREKPLPCRGGVGVGDGGSRSADGPRPPAPSPEGKGEAARRHVVFDCEGARLFGTLDPAHGTTGLLIVTGGNEVRCGAFAGQARLAAEIAAAGHPVFRFDRRGTGDSEGENRGFRHSAADIAAALAAFRAECPRLARVVGFGNCDGASALMLSGGRGFDALVLSNPWTIEEEDAAPPPAAIRSRYAEKLRNPGEWMRLLTGGVNIGKLLRGLARAAGPAPAPSTLARQMAQGLDGFDGPCRILLAGRDRTAQAFLAAWGHGDARLSHCPGASHAFVEPESWEFLRGELLAVLERS